MTAVRLELVVGQANCGKSDFAERRCLELSGSGEAPLYLGMLPRLPEHELRLRKHAARRQARWQVVEVLRGFGDVHACLDAGGRRVVLADGVSDYVDRMARRWWLVYGHARPDDLAARVFRDLDRLRARSRELVVVSTRWSAAAGAPDWVQSSAEANGRLMAALASAADRVVNFGFEGETLYGVETDSVGR